MTTTRLKRTTSQPQARAGAKNRAATEAASPRPSRKTRMGVVVSNRMQKTIVVRVDRLTRHDRFSRVIKRSNQFKVHDEANDARIGDWVRIMETRPLSKDKRWRLIEITRRAATAPAVPGSEPEAAQGAAA